ncbi:MAG: hypothetical protein AB1489_40285 [Acidobacteriota bacterium]
MRLFYNITRFFLALAFIAYGLSKGLGIQFDFGAFYSHIPAKHLTGMQLVWVFFSLSRSYQICIATAQIIAAMLLMVKRTSPLGALLFFPTILNIVLIDIFYQVQPGPTIMALILMMGNLFLLWYNRDKIIEAIKLLIR